LLGGAAEKGNQPTLVAPAAAELPLSFFSAFFFLFVYFIFLSPSGSKVLLSTIERNLFPSYSMWRPAWIWHSCSRSIREPHLR
jgi:hypothetical protein